MEHRLLTDSVTKDVWINYSDTGQCVILKRGLAAPIVDDNAPKRRKRRKFDLLVD
jgi:hypothetical protein